jgi:hypothetical protein
MNRYFTAVALVALVLGPLATVDGQTFILDDYSDASVMDYYLVDRADANKSVELFDGDYRFKLEPLQTGNSSSYHGYRRSMSTEEDVHYNVPTGSKLRTDIYAPSASTQANFGFWAQVGGPGGRAWPIVHYYNDGTGAKFRAWDYTDDGSGGANWTDIALPAGFAHEAWHTLTFTLGQTDYIWELDGEPLFVDPVADLFGTDLIETAIFMADKTYGPVYFDNFTAVVPEPATALLLALGAALLLARRAAPSTHRASLRRAR